MLNNPYVANNEAIKVQLLEEGEPLANAQLGAFFKTADSEDAVQLTLYRTDVQGMVALPRPKQPGVMLLSAVHMIEPDAATILKTGAVWESLWASMTFAIE